MPMKQKEAKSVRGGGGQSRNGEGNQPEEQICASRGCHQ